MTETNSDTTVADDDKPVTEEDLRDLKYGEDGVETSKEADEPDETEETTEETEETDEEAQADSEETTEDSKEEPAPSFVKEFPHIKGDTPEEYAKYLEEAYKNSTEEAIRLKKLSEAGEPTKKEADEESTTGSDPLTLWAKQNLDKEIHDAYADFKKAYPQVIDEAEYTKFTRKVSILSKTIMEDEGRLAPPSELYSTAAILLGWQSENTVDSKDKLNMALKDKAATGKTTSASKPTPSKSKVTDQIVAVNRAMYPDKTDAEIRKELEPYV